MKSPSELAQSSRRWHVRSQQHCMGVDGARSGWIAVWRGRDSLHHQRYESAKALVDSHRSLDVIAVDIPMGLTNSHGREAEVQARRFVGGRRACSVFSTPVRGILDAQSQPEASRRHREIDGRGFGAQSFAILCKIREWDELLLGDAQVRGLVREIHPEVSFAALNGGQGCGLSASKKSDAGASALISFRHTLACATSRVFFVTFHDVRRQEMTYLMLWSRYGARSASPRDELSACRVPFRRTPMGSACRSGIRGMVAGAFVFTAR